MTPEQAAHWIIGRIGGVTHYSREMTPLRIRNLFDLEVKQEPRYGGGFLATDWDSVRAALIADLEAFEQAMEQAGDAPEPLPPV
jgi:hypothetical protein